MRGFKTALYAAAFLALSSNAHALPAGNQSGGIMYEQIQSRSASQQVRAQRRTHGLSSLPNAAPLEVQELLKRGNRIVGKPYVYGGGHDANFGAGGSGYDCSGSVSYVLRKHLKRPLASGALMSYGKPGKGKWVTVYANAGHAFIVVAGLRLDTSSVDDPSGLTGPRWRPAIRSTAGFVARHPEGF